MIRKHLNTKRTWTTAMLRAAAGVLLLATAQELVFAQSTSSCTVCLTKVNNPVPGSDAGDCGPSTSLGIIGEDSEATLTLFRRNANDGPKCGVNTGDFGKAVECPFVTICCDTNRTGWFYCNKIFDPLTCSTSFQCASACCVAGAVMRFVGVPECNAVNEILGCS